MRSDDSEPARVEVAVVGGGPAGLTAAVALAAAGVETALICAPERRPDNRTTALLMGSVSALEALQVWQACRPYAAPLQAIRMIDATRRLVRAPPVMFEAGEIGVEAFGHNIENRHLMAALEARAAALAHLQRFDAPAVADYRERLAFVLERRIALWDVCEIGERDASADAAIRRERPNAIVRLLDEHPLIHTVAFNGTGARRLYDRHFARRAEFAYLALPSTSPANARIDFTGKLASWKALREVLYRPE